MRTDGRCPYTPNWHGVAALYAGTQAIFKEGMDAAFARHEAVAAQCRAGLAELGIKLWTAPDAVNAPTVTAAMIPDGFTWPEWKEALRRHGLICTGSFGPMDGKVFRLGHMGTQAQPYLMEQALDAIAAFLIEKETITGKEFMEIFRRVKGLPDPAEGEKKEERIAAKTDEAPAGAAESADGAQETISVADGSVIELPMQGEVSGQEDAPAVSGEKTEDMEKHLENQI